jgi:hypothetical protein
MDLRTLLFLLSGPFAFAVYVRDHIKSNISDDNLDLLAAVHGVNQ